jgi:hypothetical protein
MQNMLEIDLVEKSFSLGVQRFHLKKNIARSRFYFLRFSLIGYFCNFFWQKNFSEHKFVLEIAIVFYAVKQLAYILCLSMAIMFVLRFHVLRDY